MTGRLKLENACLNGKVGTFGAIFSNLTYILFVISRPLEPCAYGMDLAVRDFFQWSS